MRNHQIMPLFLILVLLQPIYAGDNISVHNNFTGYVDRDTVIDFPEYSQNRDSLYIDPEVAGHQPFQFFQPENQPSGSKILGEYEFTLDYVGSAGWGYCKDVQVRDDIAYCTFGAGLVILDVSDPNNPQFLSKCYTQFSPEQLTIYGDYAYVATGGKALDIIDISDKYNPVEVGYYGDHGAWKIGLDTANVPLVAAIIGGSSVLFVDVSDPYNPVLLKDHFCLDPRDIIFDGDIAFVADWSWHQIVIFNVTDYSNAFAFIYFDVPGQPYGLVKKDSLIYVSEDDGDGTPPQIQAINVSDVYNPTIVATIDDFDNYYYPRDIEYIGDTLFVSMGYLPQIQFFDISNPMEIERIGGVSVSIRAFQFDIVDNNMFVACSYSGVYILDISNLYNAYYISNYINEAGGSCKAGATYNIELADDLAYVFNCGALTPINISDPANPFALSCDDNVNGGRFDLQGVNAFSVNSMGSGGARGIDISDPYNLQTLSYLHYPATSWDIDAEGDYAYVAADTSGLQVTDITDPSNLFITGYYNEIYTDETKIAGTVTILDNIAYLGDSWGMRAIDITDPANPVKVGDYEVWTEQPVRRIVLRDSLAFLALAPTDSLTMAVVNISDPTDMTTVGIFIPPDDWHDEFLKFVYGDAHDIALSGNYAFVANGGCTNYGLLMIDISDYSNMQLVGKYDTPRDAVWGVKSRGRYVYLTDYYGMFILHVDYPAPCGDINADDSIDIFDITSLINYLYLGGPAPEYPDAADLNSDGEINIFDIVFLITFLYLGGLSPDCP